MAVGKVFLPSGKGLFQKMLAVRKFSWGGIKAQQFRLLGSL